MATTTTVAVPAGEWTLAYTAAGTVTGVVQAAPGGIEVMMRIGSGVLVGDALTAAAEWITPGEARPVDLASGDKVFVRPVGERATTVIVRL